MSTLCGTCNGRSSPSGLKRLESPVGVKRVKRYFNTLNQIEQNSIKTNEHVKNSNVINLPIKYRYEKKNVFSELEC